MGRGSSRPNGITRIMLTVLIGLLGGLVLAPAPVRAATIAVTNGNDSGSGSLRQALTEANATPEADTIVFTGVTTVTLTSGQLTITEDLTIDGGNGVTVVRAATADDFRIFEITGSATAVTLARVTIANGTAFSGGGITNRGTLTVTDSTLSNNTATNFGGGILSSGGKITVTNSTLSNNTATNFGGGIFSSGGEITVTNSTLSNNTATNDGGGIFNNVGTLTVQNSTLSGNTADRDGGGIYNHTNSTLTVQNSTLSGNTADRDGGGLFNNANSTLTVTNSTLSGNAADRDGGGLFNSGDTTLANTIVTNSPNGGDYHGSAPTLQGSNIVADGAVSGTGVITADPVLGPLQDNGGPTHTHLPAADSPAVDAGTIDIVDGTAPAADYNGDGSIDARDTLSTDQRGYARIADDTVDIGAVEVGGGDIAYRLALDPTSVTEGDSGSTTDATVTVTRHGATGVASTITVARGGTAIAGSDYTFALANGSAGSFDGSTLRFAANETEATFTLTVQGNDVDDANRTISVTLANATAPETATILAPATVTLTITNDDTESAYRIVGHPTRVTEGDPGTTTAVTVTVTRSGDITAATTVDVARGGSATMGSDYTFALANGSAGSFDGSTLRFAANTITATFTMTVRGDSMVEADETVTITLRNPTPSATTTILAPDTVTLTIANDDTDTDTDDRRLYLPLIAS